MNNKTLNKYLDYNKLYQGINYHKNEFKFLALNHKMKVAFNLKKKPK